jgi:putative transposase
MARPLRIVFPGAVYHVTSRGNARMPIFEDDEDRVRFLAILGEMVRRFNWLCHAFCLMDNHYHLLVETIDGNLSLGMRQLNGIYTQRFNRRHGRVGHVFQGRFKAILVERESHLLELCRYVVLNPVRGGAVREPGQYRWSSYRATAGLERKSGFLTVAWILGQFGKNRDVARKEYRRFVLAGKLEPSPWERLKAQCVLGGRSFLEKISPALKDKSAIVEIPRRERFVSRPALDDLLGGGARNSRNKRDRAVIAAHLEHGYSLSEIGRHLGLHYTTISKIVRRAGF